MALSSVWDAGARLLTLVRRVDQLFTLQTKVDASIDIIEQRLRAIEDRLLKIEAEGPRLVTEARSAASAAATAMSSAALNDMVTRLTRVEVKPESIDGRAGPPPGGTPRLNAPRKASRKGGDGDPTAE
jgi:hypothetical protein